MTPIHDDAVVLGRLDYSETSQVVVLFARAHGKVRAIAKGIRRGTKQRFATGIDLLESGHVNLTIRGERSATLATLTEWKQRRSFSGLRERLDRLYAAQYSGEVTTALTEDWDPHPRLYDALVETLSALCDAAGVLPAVVAYQWRLLYDIGSTPRLDACVACGRQRDLTHFSSFEGGMICRHCEPTQVEKWHVSAATVRYLLGDAGADRRGHAGTPERRDEGTKERGDEGTSGRTDERRRERRSEGNEPRARSERPSGHPGPAQRQPLAADIADAAIVGAFSVLNYHISHLMGREPKLASKVVPPIRRRMI